tara:strand:- start:1749 stop:2330 length:582 start_codon:yes stop_codon:yes gene_type:complete
MMTDIYLVISKLTEKFKIVCKSWTRDNNEIDEAVQELMLYFLQMNPETLKKIYEKDGKLGILKYGNVALRRALTTTRSPYYYKYKKYYTHINSNYYDSACTTCDDSEHFNYSINKSIQNIPNEEVNYQWRKLEEIDKELENFNWYDKKIFELYYYEGNTLDSLAEKTRISRNSLFTTIDKVRTILKETLNEKS